MKSWSAIHALPVAILFTIVLLRAEILRHLPCDLADHHRRKLDEGAWKAAPSVGDFHFPGSRTASREQTVAKILWDDDNLYVSWCAATAYLRIHNAAARPVSKDDCVEIFIAPNPDKIRNYYTFEINAIGTMLNRARTDWWNGAAHMGTGGSSIPRFVPGPGEEGGIHEDDHWIVEAAIPLKNFVRDAPHTPPRDGDRWRLNLQRLGGITNAQASTWSPLPEGVRSFHTPEAFGSVRFLNRAPPQRVGKCVLRA